MENQTHLDHWDRRHMAWAMALAAGSKDPSTQVGCIIADKRNRIAGAGFNGFPRGVEDTQSRMKIRSVKNKLMQHAERNAISFATKDLEGCTVYVWPLPPCSQCAGALIQEGIRRVVAPELTPADPHYSERVEDFELSLEMYSEAGIVTDFETVPVSELVRLILPMAAAGILPPVPPSKLVLTEGEVTGEKKKKFPGIRDVLSKAIHVVRLP